MARAGSSLSSAIVLTMSTSVLHLLQQTKNVKNVCVPLNPCLAALLSADTAVAPKYLCVRDVILSFMFHVSVVVLAT